MNANEILQAIRVIKNKETLEHAGKLAAIYKFLEAEKKNIQSVVTEPAKMLFARKTKEEKRNGQWEKTILNSGTELYAKKFTITTSRGTYSVTVPTGNKFHESICILLGTNWQKPEQTAKMIRSFNFPCDIAIAMGLARTFVSKDSLRPVMQCICLEINDGVAKVVSTDAHRLFMSRDINVVGAAGKFQYLISAADIKKLPKKLPDTFSFEELEGNKVSFLGLELKLFTEANYMQWRVVVPEYSKAITFNRSEFVAKIKEVLPYANKCTHQVNFSFDGHIKMGAQDVDFSFESTARMSYINRETPTMKIGFNGKFLLDAMNVFKTDTVKMLSHGESERATIFTNGCDSVLIMPLILPEGWGEQPEAEPKPVVVETSEVEPVEKPKKERSKKQKSAEQPATGVRPIETPIAITEDNGSIKLLTPKAALVRKLFKIMPYPYQYDRKIRTMTISGVSKSEVINVLTSNKLNIA